MMSLMRRFDSALGAILNGIAVTSLVGLFLTLVFVVVNRYGGLPSTGWTDELIELLFAWLIFIGAAGLWRTRDHFAVDLFLQILSPGRPRTALAVAGELLCLLFLTTFTYQACVFIANATDNSPVFAISKVYWYGVMPLAGVIMIGYSLARLAGQLRGDTNV